MDTRQTLTTGPASLESSLSSLRYSGGRILVHAGQERQPSAGSSSLEASTAFPFSATISVYFSGDSQDDARSMMLRCSEPSSDSPGVMTALPRRGVGGARKGFRPRAPGPPRGLILRLLNYECACPTDAVEFNQTNFTKLINRRNAHFLLCQIRL